MYNYPTGIARVYFIKKSQNKTNLLNLSSLSIWFSCISGVIFETYLSWLSSSRHSENGFIEAGVLDAYKKYVFGGNKKLTCT